MIARISLIVASISLLWLAEASSGADRLRVVATTPDLAKLAAAVGGGDVDVSAIARPMEDPHFVDARPSFIRTLNEADVLIEGGAQLEAGWLPPLVEGARNPRIATGAPGRIVASEGVELIDVPSALDRSLGDVHPLGNPHYLLDPVNAKLATQTIARGLCAVDGSRCEDYQNGAQRFVAAIDAKLPEWQAQLAPIKGLKVVTYHKNYDYFARRFGLEVVGNLEPKPGIPPSPAHLAELISRMQQDHVKLIVAEPNRERQNPEFVAAKTGARLVILPIMPGVEEAPDYISLIDYDVRQIASGAESGSPGGSAR